MGKTFVLKKFGEQEYANTVYLNFEDNPRLCELFNASLDPKVVLKALSIEMKSKSSKEKRSLFSMRFKNAQMLLTVSNIFTKMRKNNILLQPGRSLE